MKNIKSFETDRRGAKRYDMPLRISYLDPATNLKAESVAANICKNGLRFSVNTKLQKGGLLDLKIEDPFNNRLISSKAEIMWVREFISGEGIDDTSCEIGVRLSKKQLY